MAATFDSQKQVLNQSIYEKMPLRDSDTCFLISVISKLDADPTQAMPRQNRGADGATGKHLF